MRWIDCHLHVIDKDRLDYPWVAGEPPLDRTFSYDFYASQAVPGGITDSLHMEVAVADALIEAETGYVKELAARPGSLIRGCIASCRPEQDDFAAFLDRQRADPFIRGFRRILHQTTDDLSTTATFRDNVRRLSGTGFTFDLCVLPHQIPIACALVDHCPDVQFVLDHCGVPNVKDKAEHPWRAHMIEIARRPNVVVKISGVVAYADHQTWTVEDLKPFVEHSIGVFGWDRVVWGSDWPVCTLSASLTQWIEATRELIAGASDGERRRLLAQNAERIYRV